MKVPSSQPYYAVERHSGPMAHAGLRRAALALYEAGLWKCAGLHPVEQVKLWDDLRDALGLTPGHATALGVGADLAPNQND